MYTFVEVASLSHTHTFLSLSLSVGVYILFNRTTSVFFFQEYYQAKGSRLPLRLGILQETFEGCLDGLIDRYQCYRRQTEDYRNKCIDGG